MNTPTIHEINEIYANLDKINHYELLGVARDASKADITKTFRSMVAVWHIDRFGQMGLNSADLQKVRAIFQKINDVYRELSNPVERSRYDAKLEGRPDVSTVLQMEHNFLRARRALQDDKIELAKQLFDEVAAALPDDPNYQYHKLYVDYLLLPKTKEGRLVDKAAADGNYKKMKELMGSYKETTDWMHEFYGIFAIGMGDDKTARSNLKAAIEKNPNNLNAQRRLRLLERRKKNSTSESSGNGLLDTIRGWFSK